MRVRIECNQKAYAAELIEKLAGCSYVGNEERLVEIQALRHFEYNETYNDLSKKIEELFDLIPEIQTIGGINS